MHANEAKLVFRSPNLWYMYSVSIPMKLIIMLAKVPANTPFQPTWSCKSTIKEENVKHAMVHVILYTWKIWQFGGLSLQLPN